ncbi:LMBR1-like membrane protein-domain-containing protein [Boeremia exigua]|uniref:LMBR1-like membrane protein-domain-containing protein n=1 Tax=Boeremia exigua TaxID=749465 RepID=UPI001E8E19E7|nr:LMBR1-like membrane protein-domain-containing protein [Boeremia exigua]KAH6633511.1 LMBR1-like membrane protein-domain-containing protein [Boeremia exigua]
MATTTPADGPPYAIASSAAGSTAFFVLSLFAICGLVLLLLRYYLPLRTTPAHVTVPVFLAIALPASIVVLLPIDLASSAGTDTDGARGIWLSDAVVYKSWRIVYWLTFALTWAILPLLGEYCDSGYRDPKARVRYALRSNGRYWAIMLGCGIVGSVYLIWYNGFELDTFKSLAMALAYTWGLILGIYLMGHGLVAFPRSLFRYASITGRLKKIQGHAPKVHEKLVEALEKLDQYEHQVVQLKQRKNGTAKEFQEWIDELAEKGSLPESRAGTVGRSGATTIPPVITERYLADLTRKLKRARHAKNRFENEWDIIVRKAIRTQDILDSKASQRLEFKNSAYPTPQHWHSRLTVLTPYTRYLLHVHVIPALTYFTWVITILASISIVWSECVRELQEIGGHKLSIIGWTVVHRQSSSRSQIGFGGQLIAAAWLCYMCICAFYSLTEVKIWGNRALVRRNTYQESATWYGLQVAKLTVPLSYNFLTMTDKPIWTHTMFHRFLGRLIDLSPLGKNFSAFFPIFILVPVLATAFGLYAKIRSVCGFADLLDDDEDAAQAGFAGEGSWREGRALIDREIHGASGNVLGLTSRAAAAPVSAPVPRYTDIPTGEPSSIADTVSEAPAPRARPERRRVVEEEEDEGFFESFASRVKNTFEATDFSFSRPAWMGGDDEVDAGRRARGTDSNEGFLSLFGGRAEEGRVRL